MRPRPLRTTLAVAAMLLATGPALAQQCDTAARFAVLMDEAGTVLFEKNADALFDPGSMVRLMVTAVVFQQIDAGRFPPDETFTISEHAWLDGGVNSGRATMFATLASDVKASDLLQGLVIVGATDAAIAFAEGIAGSEAAFVEMMNAHAATLGMTNTQFSNVTGAAGPGQYTTARDLAVVAREIVTRFKPLYSTYYDVPGFTWNSIRQDNRNSLLSIGMDGLATGRSEAGDFGAVASTEKDGPRLFAVVHGLETIEERAAAVAALTDPATMEACGWTAASPGPPGPPPS